MTANTASNTPDYNSFMQEISQLRKEIADAKQLQQQYSTTTTQQQQPQQQLSGSQLGAGAGATQVGTKKQGKAGMADMKLTLDKFNDSLRQLQEQVQSLKFGQGRADTYDEYEDRFGGEFEGNGHEQQQGLYQGGQLGQQGQGQQQQGQFPQQQGQQGFQQQGQQGGQFQQGQQGGKFQQGQQAGQFQQGQQGGFVQGNQLRTGPRGGNVVKQPDQYQTRATGPGKAPVQAAMPGQGLMRPNRPRPLPLEKRTALIQNKPKTLKETFQAELVEEIAFLNWKRKRLVLIGEERFLERALSRINSHNIQCLPVVSAQGKGIIGTIDVLDIIQQLIDTFDRNSDKTIQQGLRRDFMNRQVGSLLSQNSYVISSAASLYMAVGYMIKCQQDRFVVVDRKVEGDVQPLSKDNPEMDVDGLFTLHDVVRFLVQNSILMRQEPDFHKSLHELGLGQNKPKIVKHTIIAADAFKQIGRNCCMGLAVVDDNDCLIGNISATDLKGVTRNNCPILNSSVQDFITRDQKRGWWERPISIDLNDSLYHTIHQFVSLGIHRMYVVDDQHRPIGEVSLRDVMTVVWRIIQ
jgi:predicted transcriptional regulator